MSMIIRGFWVLVWVVWAGVGVAQESDPGEGYFQRGQFEDAVQYWEKNCSSVPNSLWEKDCSKLPVKQRIYLATAHQNLGHLRAALGILQPFANSHLPPVERVQVLMSLGNVYLDMSVFNKQLLGEIEERVCSNTKSPLTKKAEAFSEANTCFHEAEELLPQIEEKERPLLRANISNQRGNLLVAKEKVAKEKNAGVLAEALEAYQESAKLAKGRDQVLVAKALVNYIQVLLTGQENCEQAVPKFAEVLPELRNLPDSHDKAFTLLGLAALFKPAVVDSSKKLEKPSCSFSNEKDGLQLKEQLRLSAIQEALKVAKKLEDKTAIAYANGYLAQLYAEQKHYDDAIQLTRQAIFYAQDSGRFYVNPTATAWPGQSVAYVQSYPRPQSEFISYPEQLYRWEWQLGKYLYGQGKLEEAVKAYDSAAYHLELVRKNYGCTSSNFSKDGETFYLERAELLLNAAKNARDGDEKKNFLEKATGSIDSRQEAGLRNYFQDECITEKFPVGKERKLQNNEVLRYLVVFGNRLESVLKFSDGSMQQETQECDSSLCSKHESLSENIEKLRKGIANRESGTPLIELNKAISKLIITKSFQEQLSNYRNKIDTLLIVPSNELFRVPFASLVVGDPDKKSYPNEEKPRFIEHYAISELISWKLSSVSPGVIDLKQDFALLGGLIIESPLSKMELEQPKGKVDDHEACLQRSKAVEIVAGDSRSVCTKPLCYVDKEIKQIEDIIQNRTSLLGTNFTVDKLESSFKNENENYPIVHLSTHGYFDQFSHNSWLCTYKGEILTLDKLEEILQGKKAKLLTLSACETALGAELGLAGISVKVGTQSALGSLWPVDDQSTSELMRRFYENLTKEDLKDNLAKALQRAQLDLLEGNDFKDPYYWAGFLLIGNWQNK